MEAELARQRQQLADLRRQQAALTASLAVLSTDLKRTGLELAKAVRQLDRVTASLEESRAALESYRLQIQHLAENLERVAAELVTTRTELAEREALLQDHLRLAYEQSQTSMLEVLLSTDSFGEGLQPARLHAHPLGRRPPPGGRDPRDAGAPGRATADAAGRAGHPHRAA